MAKFIYKMQNILDVKINLETQAKQEFGQAVFKLNEEKEKLETIRNRRVEYIKHYQDIIVNRIDVMEITLTRTGITMTEEEIKKQLSVVRTAERNVEVARKKLEKVVQERKIQEKLKEKAFEAFQKELLMQEQKEIDELVSFRYGQKLEEEEKTIE